MSEQASEADETPEVPPTKEVVAALVANHREFLKFVERRVGSRDLAEEILQSAFVKNVEKFDTVRDTAVGWFYKVLRNAIIDYRRRKDVADRSMQSFATDVEAGAERDDELHGVVCKCIAEIATTLKPEYADALHRIEVEGVSVKDYAEQIGISTSNAGVRVFRAREALRKQVVRSCGTCADHGCLDCTCTKTPTATSRCGHTQHKHD
ncbi:MAG: sigma-70 family RNA polymerase sigma factor [Deltaproteobacteria bacterium]|nr:sigma-70 family RNA polymerase sigma factor [Deltaproteobacteria bacterium]MDQ3295666.1 sigma-70 family RNA polymerase sigma factor [Myxococcota bacterium]